tara:strand:- start:2949 stop:3575 length:627 start_codon:yes stop_codon:yes gene_type:complete
MKEKKTKLADIYATLSSIDVKPFAEKKNKLDYLPWAKAHEIMMLHYPDYIWRWEENIETGDPYFITDTGYYVVTSVIVEGHLKKEILPVTDYANKVLEKPNIFDINTAIRRCYVKCLAQFGLGIQLYIGEKSRFMVSEKPVISDALKNKLRKLCEHESVTQARIDMISQRFKNEDVSVAWVEAQIKDLEKKNKAHDERNTKASAKKAK